MSALHVKVMPWLAALCAAVAPAVARPQQPPPVAAPAGASTYDVAVEVRLSPIALQEGHQHYLGLGTPPQPTAYAPIGRQADAAYRAVVERLFRRGAPGEAAAHLRVEIVKSGTSLDGDGWFTFVEHDLRLVAADGAEVARWGVRGEAPIEGWSRGVIPQAFARAAVEAAREFEEGLEATPEVARWLGGLGARPQVVVPQPPRPRRRAAAAAAPAPGPPRGAYALYLDGGVALGSMEVSRRARSSDWSSWDGVRPTPQLGGVGAVRLGLAAPWGIVRLGHTRWLSEVALDAAAVRVTTVGLDLGGRLRRGDFEFTAGAGWHRVTGVAAYPWSSSPDQSETRGFLAGFAAASFAPPMRDARQRLRFGVEVKSYFDATLPIGASPYVHLPTTAEAFIGLELPLLGR